MCLSQIPIESYRKFSKTIPNCVSAKIQFKLLENILRQYQILSSRISIESPRKHSNTIPNLVLAKIQLKLLENILRQFQIVS